MNAGSTIETNSIMARDEKFGKTFWLVVKVTPKFATIQQVETIYTEDATVPGDAKRGQALRLKIQHDQELGETLHPNYGILQVWEA